MTSAMPPLPNYKERLQPRKFSRADCKAAINGQKIPDALGLSLHQICTIRGIRYHPDFAHELRGVLPEFTRALNARSIMSNVIPDMKDLSDEPYCIWHPDVASEDTYRSLVLKYPSMAYQVGRACAVAGYLDLYQELDILPEIHIADDARECGNMTILNDIMSKPVRYKVMNDYDRSIDASNPEVANLNGDTAARWVLDIKQQFYNVPDEDDTDNWELADYVYPDGFSEQRFNITEDMNIDWHTTSGEEIRNMRPPCDMVKLLTEPLPRDLPTVHKDILISMAAYYGDIDRYLRLRRPKLCGNEFLCCMHGAYYNTMFAVWWSKQDISAMPGSRPLAMAIEARFIMNNVLARVTKAGFEAPYLIWYPTLARCSTYRKLAELRPDMLPQIIRACIVAGYKDLFNELVEKVVPDVAVMNEATARGDSHYRQVLDSRVQKAGLAQLEGHEGWKMHTQLSLQGSENEVYKYFDFDQPGGEFEDLYNGSQCRTGDVELMACIPDEWKIPKDDEDEWKDLDYVGWPPGLMATQ